ncbi:hypothetical protein C3747_144g95 [Trypanosoma cruzi]|uniref:BAR domain-containing protein n=2 Tax=Trypanosoma cruzi TaxID=5693 RepID=Q4CXY8_TRYCC|nr:hypothetical protein, conserved [Trypanosoma cruzi]EAN85144.1 hypothetical protein, conserved [Trypanosoma cruzi]PWV04776.1 hypothetical protein C3747_144g95 [Trypanosoma cruzi]RNC46367.1 hypothetical protein TcCL_NonESM03827 [Trypanosoma cruzi]|eukprot:XP_806995.1 hypothetical protein [Trypanosoma cruzi strain CL Brener]
MKKFMLNTKASLGLVGEKTVDEDYNKRSASLKALNEALNEYSTAMDKAKHAMREVMHSLGKASKAFEKLNSGSCIPEPLKDFSEDFKKAIEHLQQYALQEFMNTMETTVIKTGHAIRADYEECVRVDQQRQKTVNEYDVYRSAVDKKETEYAKKGKDLKESKTYEEDTKTRDELKADYEASDKLFKSSHDALESNVVSKGRLCMREFFCCTSEFLSALSTEMKRLHEKSLLLGA